MSQHLAWYVSRSTGIVTWGLLIASMLWGFCYATRILGRRARPWWMLGVHRFLGALTVTFVIVHVLALVADNYTHFGLAQILVPFASTWRRVPVALGIVGFYILIAVEATSLLQKHLPRPVWRQIHLASYGLFAFAPLLGFSFSLLWPAFLTLPFAILQIVWLRNVAMGGRPIWTMLSANAISLFGLTAYFIMIAFWLR